MTPLKLFDEFLSQSDFQNYKSLIDQIVLMHTNKANTISKYFEQTWTDIKNLTSIDFELYNMIKTDFCLWCDANKESYEENYTILISLFHLRLTVLETIYQNTNEIFHSVIKSTKSDKMRKHLINEIEELLVMLNAQDDLKEIEKLRDRFFYLSEIVDELTDSK
jgi:hypothetical protein